MRKIKLMRVSPKLLNYIGLAILLFSNFFTVNIGNVYAREKLSGEYYYYANGNRIQLTPSSKWMSVKFTSNDPSKQSIALNKSSAILGSLNQARQILPLKLTLIPLKNGLTKETINAFRVDTTSFLQVNPVFQTTDAEMVLTDEFIATFPLTTSRQEIDQINSSNSVEIIEQILGQENTFVLRVNQPQLDVLSVANLYQESGLATYAAPNFVRIMKSSPLENQTRQSIIGPLADTNDTLYTDQWYLKNTQQYGTGMTFDADVDATEAWDYTMGSSSIIIAVIDEGVDLTHEDYSSKLVPGYDATGLGSGGAPSGNDAHGTNVAGLAAAIGNNNLGMVGLCPNCKIMPVRIAYDNLGFWVTTDEILADGITWAYQHGADILNNSWGGGLDVTVIDIAISNAKTYGRGGKGAIIVFAAGNDNLPSVGYPAYLDDVIAVGASNICDQRKTPTGNLCNGFEASWGSDYGISLDVSAPGVWLDSTDIMGSAGYDGSNYYRYFNGTSGASPIVSGILGLMLSVNPNMTATQAQTILQNTADDVNGGGFDVEMGYGRVNANRAVQTSSFTFSDTPSYYWAWQYVERLYHAGITGGCSASPLNYCPENLVTRDQMAIFLGRGTQGSSFVPPNVTPTFGDTAGNFAEDWIEVLKNNGITGGCGNGNYCPTSGVTRAQMAIFLERSMHGSSFVPPNVAPSFGDTAGNFAEDWIEALKNDGITGGCGNGNYCPDDIVTRAQMAVFLVKAFSLP